MFPKALQDILEKYYDIQEKSPDKILTSAQKKALVNELISAYNNLDDTDKIDVLVPARWEFLEDHPIYRNRISDPEMRYDIHYKWPPNDGFAGSADTITLQRGEVYDRIGSSNGRCLSPVSSRTISTILERAIPYYIPEQDITQSPAYHRYEVVYPHRKKPDIAAKRGRVAHAFWCNPDDGGGIQVRLFKRIKDFEGSVLIESREHFSKS